MLGALQCTCTEHLSILANLTPLNIMRRKELVNYALRTLNNPANPFREHILRTDNDTSESSVILKHPPVSEKIKKELILNKINPKVLVQLLYT